MKLIIKLNFQDRPKSSRYSEDDEENNVKRAPLESPDMKKYFSSEEFSEVWDAIKCGERRLLYKNNIVVGSMEITNE